MMQEDLPNIMWLKFTGDPTEGAGSFRIGFAIVNEVTTFVGTSGNNLIACSTLAFEATCTLQTAKVKNSMTLANGTASLPK